MIGWWRALRQYWEDNKEFEFAVLPAMWPLPAVILALVSWDVATRETAVPWHMWAAVASQIALLIWLFWLRFFRARD
ncbi:hypothetical protein [Hyphomicrobium sp. DMF-1]|jgi:hypothetical protein|uniref:hypothetical protein n=1 Tax=Hyphomicrobium sp. DMF-1 TaxID=3019544 RepID=UPI0022EC0BAE|nr:hypothetical protein [Hyphomicrobium sp. DMF-1]WBT40279.1 hypothetical protein PE058_10450 [Hyphomicrobium sp. DMF-1]